MCHTYGHWVTSALPLPTRVQGPLLKTRTARKYLMRPASSPFPAAPAGPKLAGELAATARVHVSVGKGPFHHHTPGGKEVVEGESEGG